MNKRYAVVAPIKLGEVGKPQMLLRTGMFRFRDIGDHEFTPDDLREMVANFKAGIYGQDITVNIEHMHELGALGDVLDVWTQNNDTELWGVHKYNDFGAPQVKEGRWHYNSVEVYHEWQHPETGVVYHNVLSGVAHTNYPRIKNMQKIAASENADLPEFVPMDDPDITPPKPPSQKSQGVLNVDEKEQLAKLAEKVKSLEDGAASFAEKLEASEKARKEAETKVTTLSEQLTETTKQLGIERAARELVEFSEGLNGAMREGRLTPAERDEYLKDAGKYSAELREFILADVKKRAKKITMSEVGIGNNATGETGANGTRVETTFNEAGQRVTIMKDRADLAELAHKIHTDQKIPYGAAMKLAQAQLRKGGQA